MQEITREQARDMAEAHAEGMHADLPRDGCPECEDRPLHDYPREKDIARIELEDRKTRMRGVPADTGIVRRYGRTTNPHVVAIQAEARKTMPEDPGYYIPCGQTDPA